MADGAELPEVVQRLIDPEAARLRVTAGSSAASATARALPVLIT